MLQPEGVRDERLEGWSWLAKPKNYFWIFS